MMEQLFDKMGVFFERIIEAAPAAVAIILGALVVKFLLGRGFRLIAQRTSLTENDLRPTLRLLNWALLAVTVVLLLGVVGFNLGGLWTMFSTILAMVAIGFVAVWSVLSNVSCTFMILIFRPFAVGDDIEIMNEPVQGRVVDLNFFYTTLKTEDDAFIQIPNNQFFQKAIKRRLGKAKVSLAEQLNRESPGG